MRNPDGSPQKGFSFRRFPTPAALAFEVLGINRIWPGNPVNRRYRCLDLDPLQPQVVEQPAGACFLIRRSDWEHLAGFDEGFYPVWFEDVDFCRRALDGGFGVWMVPEAQAFHVGGHSIGSMAPCRKQVQWYDSLLRYAAKHFRPAGYGWVWLAGVVGVVPRAIAGMIQQRTLGPIGCSFQILKLLGSRLVTRPPSGQMDRPGSDG